MKQEHCLNAYFFILLHDCLTHTSETQVNFSFKNLRFQCCTKCHLSSASYSFIIRVMVKLCSIDLSNFFGKSTLIISKINFNQVSQTQQPLHCALQLILLCIHQLHLHFKLMLHGKFKTQRINEGNGGSKFSTLQEAILMFTNAISKIYKKSILPYFVFLSIETSLFSFKCFSFVVYYYYYYFITIIIIILSIWLTKLSFQWYVLPFCQNENNNTYNNKRKTGFNSLLLLLPYKIKLICFLGVKTVSQSLTP